MPPAEEQLWEGSPSLKALAIDFVVTTLFAILLIVVVVSAYNPALRALSGLSRDTARFVAGNEPGASTTRAPCTTVKRSEERRVGKECRSRWSPYH